MSDDYDKITAKHYAAFRPMLHAPILSKCLMEDEQFNLGLDVGCGTGRSTIALAKYCNSVIGIDPSTEMLDIAIKNPKIEYRNGLLEESNMTTDSFDIITFAGVLFYAKSQRLYDEVIRISKQGSKIIVYDFEIALKDAFKTLDLPSSINATSGYNHEMNFLGLKNAKLLSVAAVKDKVLLSISPSNLTHLVLSEKLTYEKLKFKFGFENISKSVENMLLKKSNGKNLNVEANIFYSLYENIK